MVTLKQKAGLFQIGLNWYPNAPLFCVKNEEGQRVRASFYMHNKLVHSMTENIETYFSKGFIISYITIKSDRTRESKHFHRNPKYLEQQHTFI